VKVTANLERAKFLLLCFLTLMLLFALAACQQAPPPAPPDTRAADEAAIRALNDEWIKIWAAPDAAKLASYFADDGVLLYPDFPVVQGRAGAQKVFEAYRQNKNEWTISKIEVARAGDLAYQWGTGKATIQDKKGKPVEMRYKYVTVLKKQADGSWKFAVDTSIPEPPAKPTARQAK
jgi:uncharacterized protein (TIGR02246 family)